MMSSTCITSIIIVIKCSCEVIPKFSSSCSISKSEEVFLRGRWRNPYNNITATCFTRNINLNISLLTYFNFSSFHFYIAAFISANCKCHCIRKAASIIFIKVDTHIYSFPCLLGNLYTNISAPCNKISTSSKRSINVVAIIEVTRSFWTNLINRACYLRSLILYFIFIRIRYIPSTSLNNK